MSGKCDNCDCADSTQCVKKGNSYDLVIVETENRSMDTIVDSSWMLLPPSTTESASVAQAAHV